MDIIKLKGSNSDKGLLNWYGYNHSSMKHALWISIIDATETDVNNLSLEKIELSPNNIMYRTFSRIYPMDDGGFIIIYVENE